MLHWIVELFVLSLGWSRGFSFCLFQCRVFFTAWAEGFSPYPLEPPVGTQAHAPSVESLDEHEPYGWSPAALLSPVGPWVWSIQVFAPLLSPSSALLLSLLGDGWPPARDW